MTAEKKGLSVWMGDQMGKVWFQAILVGLIAAGIGGAAVFSMTVWPNKDGLTATQSWYLWLSVLVVVFVWFYGIKIPWVQLAVHEMKDAYAGIAMEQTAPATPRKEAAGSLDPRPQATTVEKES